MEIRLIAHSLYVILLYIHILITRAGDFSIRNEVGFLGSSQRSKGMDFPMESAILI